MYACACEGCMCIYRPMFLHECMYVCVYMCVNVYFYLYIYVYLYVCV